MTVGEICTSRKHVVTLQQVVRTFYILDSRLSSVFTIHVIQKKIMLDREYILDTQF